jgi:ribosomal protein S27E
MVDNDTNWYCVDCSTVLGKLQGGELIGVKEVPSQNYETRGPNLKVTCPECGRVKIWFTSDNITRALYQLINAIAGESAKKMLHEVNKRQNS